MIIDCSECALQNTSACEDCVVTVLLAMTPVAEHDDDEGSGSATAQPLIELAADEEEALRHLAEAGMVAPVRMVPKWRDDAMDSTEAAG